MSFVEMVRQTIQGTGDLPREDPSAISKGNGHSTTPNTPAPALPPAFLLELEDAPPPPPPPPEEVFTTVRDSIRARSGVNEDQASLFAFWCMTSWFQDAVAVMPCLTVSGPYPIGDRILLSLAPWCLRARILAGLEHQTFTVSQRETLLISTPSLTDRQAARLGTLTCPSFAVQSASNSGLTPHAFAVNTGQSPLGKHIQHGIHVHVPVFEPGLPVVTSRSGRGPWVNTLCQRYRDEWYLHVFSNPLVTTGLSPELNEVAAAMASCLPHAPVLVEKLFPLLRANASEQRVAMSVNPESLVIEATLNLSRGDTPTLYARTIAAECNRLLKDRGERITYTPEKVGRTLHTVGLPTRRLSQTGNGLLLDQSTLDRIDYLGTMYGVEAEAQQITNSSPTQTTENTDDRKESR